MAQQTVTYLKGKYNTGDMPTEQDFHDWLDSYFHKTDTVPKAQIEDGEPITQLIATNGTYALAAGKMIELIVFEDVSSGTVEVGTTAGASDIIDDNLTGGTPLVERIDYYVATATTIYFTGNFSIKIYLR